MSAEAMPRVADARPAAAYEPVCCCTMSNNASGTMAEGSRPANPAIRRTGADGSRQTERYARTVELVSHCRDGTVGDQTTLTTYGIPEASTQT
jgi:hypothetical protein